MPVTTRTTCPAIVEGRATINYELRDAWEDMKEECCEIEEAFEKELSLRDRAVRHQQEIIERQQALIDVHETEIKYLRKYIQELSCNAKLDALISSVDEVLNEDTKKHESKKTKTPKVVERRRSQRKTEKMRTREEIQMMHDYHDSEY